MEQKKKNGAAQLPDAAERMRLEVVELELRARYWKAQYEIREYTLKSEEIQPKYDEWMAAQKVKNEEAQARFEESLKELQKNGANIQVDGQPTKPIQDGQISTGDEGTQPPISTS